MCKVDVSYCPWWKGLQMGAVQTPEPLVAEDASTLLVVGVAVSKTVSCIPFPYYMLRSC